MDQKILFKLIIEAFNHQEVRTLCFELNVPYDDLPGKVYTVKSENSSHILNDVDVSAISWRIAIESARISIGRKHLIPSLKTVMLVAQPRAKRIVIHHPTMIPAEQLRRC